MNVVQAFADYLSSEDVGVATLGQDLFISRAPSSNSVDENGGQIPEALWWLTAGGGSSDGKFHRYALNVYYRNRNSNVVYDKLQALASSITRTGCLSLEGYDVTRVEMTGLWSDQDLDDESRTVGLLQITITTYEGV